MEIDHGISTMWLFIHCFQIKLELTRVDFSGGGKPEKNPWGKDENQQQTEPTHDPGSNTRHTGGRRALSPLRHPCPYPPI